MTVTLHLEPVPDSAQLAECWQALEAQVPHSFFQSWAWTGCRFSERFDDPILLRARDRDATLAMALFNRRRGRLGATTLYLGESGTAVLDAPYIEYNAPLIIPAAPASLRADLLRAARFAAVNGSRPAFPRRLVLSGVAPDIGAAAASCGGRVTVARAHQVPWLDLSRVRADGMGHLSANTRQQLRRSLRRYEAAGPLRVARAVDATQAHAFLDAMADLHQRTWTRRGKPGAFADPFFARFHHELIDRAPDRVDLLRVTAGAATVGYLHNFVHQGRVSAYQSGFDYDGADSHQKPGLTCHWLAIAMYAAEGQAIYDFLAGADRYKRSLASDEGSLSWLTISPVLAETLRRA